MTQELADSIKLIRNRHNDGRTIDPLQAIQAINALVDLVGEQNRALANLLYVFGTDDDGNQLPPDESKTLGCIVRGHKTLTKAAPIAALKEEV